MWRRPPGHLPRPCRICTRAKRKMRRPGMPRYTEGTRFIRGCVSRTSYWFSVSTSPTRYGAGPAWMAWTPLRHSIGQVLCEPQYQYKSLHV